MTPTRTITIAHAYSQRLGTVGGIESRMGVVTVVVHECEEEQRG